MVTMELTSEITEEQLQLLAIAAANVAGGRHEFRADATIRQESKALVAEMRKVKRNEAKRETYKWRNVGERFAFDIGYSEAELSRIAEWQDVIAILKPMQSHLRMIARALFAPAKFERLHMKEVPESERAEYRAHVLSDWRERVRQYRDAVAANDPELIGAIPLSLADMRAGHGSRFYNYAVKRWNTAYPGQEFLFGSDVSDAFQTGMLSAIESGHWVSGRPIYGMLWRHMALAVRRAIWANTRFTYDAPEAEFDWAEWERTANDAIPAHVFRSNGNRQTLAEWAEYSEWRAIRDAMEATRERIAAERAERMQMLSESRRAIATLINSGMTFARIANMLGRNADSLVADLAGEPLALAARFLPSRDMTDAERAERKAEFDAMEAHASNLRTAFADMQADNYANGRVFKRGATSVPASRESGTYRVLATTGEMERDAYRVSRIRAERNSIPFGMVRVNRAVASQLIRDNLDVRVAESFAIEADYLERKAS